jgi:prophage regulatory protein
MNPQKKTVEFHRSETTNLNVSEVAALTGLSARSAGQVLRILRMKQLVERTGLSRATLYVLMSTDPTFPKKIKLTERTVGFLEAEVNAWIAARAESRCVEQ